MDVVADRLHGGSKLRVFTLIDVYTRECLAAVSAFRMGAAEVVKVLEQIQCHRGAPKRIYCDQGSEFAGHLVDLVGVSTSGDPDVQSARQTHGQCVYRVVYPQFPG